MDPDEPLDLPIENLHVRRGRPLWVRKVGANLCGCAGTLKSLKQLATEQVCDDFARLKWLMAVLPPSLRLDIYECMHGQDRLCQLSYDWSDLGAFAAMLTLTDRMASVERIFQALLDHGCRLGQTLVTSYGHLCATLSTQRRMSLRDLQDCTNVGLAFARFLNESGWYEGAEEVLKQFIKFLHGVVHPSGPVWSLLRHIEANLWLITAYNSFCALDDAVKTRDILRALLAELEAADGEAAARLNRAPIYIQFALLDQSLGDNSGAVACTNKALAELRTCGCAASARCVVETCRLASRVLVARRHLRQAALLARHALSMARAHFDDARRLPAPIADYAFYLMNVDQQEASAHLYELALSYRKEQFGSNNLRVALANEDVAYALYVQEYSSGNFARAREHAEQSIRVAQLLVPDNHLMLASSRRVKALVLEEIAIESHDKRLEAELLADAEELHTSALAVCKRALGEHNLQTAKHYGNLGRLYQSLHRFEQAEAMHKKAIRIKEAIVGANDYEVALSCGHLASLYNYDLGRYAEAESLYVRSVGIGMKLFGPGYSGLEYDYRGLVHVYVAQNEPDKAMDVVQRLHEWRTFRDADRSRLTADTVWKAHIAAPPLPTARVLDEYFKKDE